MSLAPQDLDILVRTVIGEAANEGPYGHAAVAHVLRNRSMDPRWPDSPREVALQPKQFSAWNGSSSGGNDLVNKYGPDDPLYQKVANVVKAVWSGQLPDPTGGASHYYSPAGMQALVEEGAQSNTLPRWLQEENERRGGEPVKIGGHYFTGRVQMAQNNTGSGRQQSVYDLLRQSSTAPVVDSRQQRVYDLLRQPKPDPVPEAVPDPATQHDMSFDDVRDSVRQGITLGYGDEYTAHEDALFGRTRDASMLDLIPSMYYGAKEFITGEDQPREWFNYDQPYWDRYGTSLEAERKQQAEFGEAHPWLDTGLEMGGAVAGTAAALPSSLLRATTVGGMIGKGALIGTGDGALYGYGTGEGGAANRAANAVPNAVLGAAGGALFPPAAAAVGLVGRGVIRIPGISNAAEWAKGFFHNNRMYNRNGITPEGREVLRQAGIDADQMSAKLSQSFQNRAKDATAPAHAASAAVLDEFDIPAYRHNITGETDDWRFYEGGRRGKFNRGTTKRLRAAHEDQSQAVRRAADDIGRNITGGDELAGDAVDATVMVQGKLREDATRAENLAKDAYGTFHASKALIPGAQFGQLAQRMRMRVDDEIAGLGDDTPSANRILRMVDNLVEQGKRGGVSVEHVNRISQVLNKLKPSGSDIVAINAMRQELGDWFDNLVTNDLMSGDVASAASWTQAKAMWRNYMKTYGGKDGRVKFISEMVDQNASPEKVAAWLFGMAKVGSGKLSSIQVGYLKDILGEGSREWQAVRQAMWREIVSKGEPQLLKNRIKEFLDGRSKLLAEKLYTKSEIAQMRRYVNALDKLIPPQGAVNYSNTGYENASSVRQITKALLRIIAGGSEGGMAGEAAGEAAATAMKGSEWLRTRALLKGVPLRQKSTATAAAAPVLGNKAVEEHGGTVKNIVRNRVEDWRR